MTGPKHMTLEEKRRALLELRLRQRRDEQERVAPVPRDGALPSSFQQEGLWYLHQLDPAASVYHIPLALRLRGPLDAAALAGALHRLVARHESLRTRFTADGRQLPEAPPPAWPLPRTDVAEGGLDDWLRATAERPFDLAAGPLLRTELARLGPDDHVLLLVLHHVVADGWSLGILCAELTALLSAGPGADPLPPLPIQPADHAAWQRRRLSGAALEDQLGYWRRTLAGIQTLEFPADRPRPAQPTGAGALLARPLPDGLAGRLRALAAAEQASFLAVLLAGFLTVLRRYTGQDDLAVGSVFSGRTRSEIEPLVGFFANTLVLRTSLAGDPTFRDLVRRCHDTVLGASAHQEVPFGLVVDAVNPERVAGRNPLFQVSFTLQAKAVTEAALAVPGVAVAALPRGATSARFDLAVAAEERPGDGIDLTVEYSTELFDEARIERFTGHLATVLARAADDPGTRLGDLDVLTPAERTQVLHGWNPAPVPRPGAALLHTLFAERAAEAPARAAMRFAGADLAYGALDERANRLAHVLIAAGVKPRSHVGVLLERGFDLPAAQLAVLKSGGAWVPLDPQYPRDRLAYQLADAGVALVLTTADLADRLPDGVATVVLDAGAGDGQPATAPDVEVHPEDTAYVIYTSGSTGRPKGVLVPHRAAVHFCRNLVELFGLGPGDRVLQLANPTFDVSVSDFFATFSAGATVVGAPRATLFDPDGLQALLRDERITFGDIPPAVLRLLDPEPLTDLRVLFIGMEPFGAELVNRWARPGRQFHNGYGPTEVTITCTDYRCPDEPLTAAPPIGRAMANHRAYVLDPQLRPVPIGVPGELYMAGVGLAHGYLGRPDLTAEKFLPDPFTAEPGERMYATGDLVRWSAAGQLEFLGRADRQVKLRGLRVELGEVEHTVNGFPGVRGSAVVLRQGGTAQAHLAAYVVPEPGREPDLAALREHLAERLPLHMVPAALQRLDALPLTSSGKVDEARLPAPADPAAGRPERRAPATGTQRRLAGLWAGLLGTGEDEVGADDTFFGLGGNSMQSIQLIARIRDAFAVDLEPRQLFSAAQLDQLAALVDGLVGGLSAPPGSGAGDAEDAEIAELEALLARKRAAREGRQQRPGERIPAAPRGAPLPCSHQQEGLWLLHQLDPAASTYHLPLALRVRGALDVDALRRAFTALVARHESLRTRFEERDGAPVQVIDPPPAAWPLPVQDVTDAERWLHDGARAPFDLAAGPLLRTSLARVGPGEHLLLLVVHHIVADGWSVAVLADELSRVYTGETLAPLDLQPADHAAWQRRGGTGPDRDERLEEHLAYWKRALDGLPVLEFPADRPRPARPSGAGAQLGRRLPDGLGDAIRGIARRERATFLAVALAGFGVVLHRYTGQHDLAVGSVFSGRTRSELEPLVGYFANVVVLRTSTAGRPTFAELVRRCHDTVLDATAHQDVPFGLVVDVLQPERVPGRNPLFQVSFTLQTAEVAGAEVRLGGAAVEPVPAGTDGARFDLTIALTDGPDGALELAAEYSTELFDAGRIERLVEHLTTVLQAATEAPDTPIDALPLLGRAELRTVVRDWNPAPVHRPGGLLHELAARHAAARPGHAAMRFAGAELTYAELEERANRLARVLAEDHGVGPGDRVGVLLDRGLDQPVAQAAVLKTGAAWLPIDPHYPAQRIAFQLADGGVPVVLTTTALADRLPEGLPRLRLDDPATAARLAGEPATAPAVDVRPEDLAYIMYTSGSTGTPKGVMIPHRAAVQFARSTAVRYAITERDRLAQVANTAFDVSIFDFYAAFAGGATVVGAPRGTLADPAALGELLRDERITVTYVPPALLGLMDPGVPRDLRLVMVAGETCPAELAGRWSAPHRDFRNGYGPTETTVISTDYPCRPGGFDGRPPIGRPMDNQLVYVLDAGLRPVPIGVTGQLYIGGAGLARGYHGRPDLTADRFVPDPFAAEPGARMYATGDLARWRADGNLDFVGRADRQVQIRGMRIEPGEIEYALAAQPGVRQAVVLVKDAGTANARLVAYAVPEAGPAPDPAALRDRLGEQLPPHMVPRQLLVLPELPRDANGKIDVRRLPDPGDAAGAGHVPPAGATQHRLAGIWSAVLGVPAERVGAHDTFFDLGGNSLQTAQLITRIREATGAALHPRELFANPTLERLAARIDGAHEGGEPAGDPGSPLVPLRAGGDRAPLFLVHAVGGTVGPYLPLAGLLGADRPVHGLQGSAGDDGVPGLAAAYTEAIRGVQPHGPYHIGGWSFGGTVAVEIGRRLLAAGEPVAFVALLDTGLPPAEAFDEAFAEARLRDWFAEDLAGAGVDLAALGDELDARFAAFAANTRAFLAHRPESYPGRLVYLAAAEDDPDAGRWRALAGAFERHTIGGDHYTLLRPPHLATVARILDTLLSER
ncbi:amino acid adenylation domain-containing protein [Dactylosporangium sp. CA-092794]|uniref:amino acid adenylation domain-containing protein n=1 Tax=Dactylosporangium sp. CA-092794 TaxID=3239929 RepID=UPI003D93F28E